MEKILSLFKKQQDGSDEAAQNNRYFTWDSPFQSEEDRYAIWHTEYGFDGERNLDVGQDNVTGVIVVDELSEPNSGDVTTDQPVTTQPPCNENGDVVTTETFTYSQLDAETSEENGDTIHVSTCTRILLIVGLVICKPFGQIMFDNYFLSRYFEYHGAWEEAARRLRIAIAWGIVTYVSFVLYMASLALIIYFSL